MLNQQSRPSLQDNLLNPEAKASGGRKGAAAYPMAPPP